MKSLFTVLGIIVGERSSPQCYRTVVQVEVRQRKKIGRVGGEYSTEANTVII